MNELECEKTFSRYDVLSIDALVNKKYDWDCNDWHKIDSVNIYDNFESNEIIELLIDEGILYASAIDLVTAEDIDDCTIRIFRNCNCQPLYDLVKCD